ncbi:MAG: hypothetical protein SPF17_05530 [Candidatus Mucispirillum faecigallinarum]|nr:hypothetical protein [Candidatus Mucispirillum faecigallinarum]
MANRKEVAEQNKQAEQVNTQAEQANTDAQNNKAPVENKNDAKVNEAASNKDDKAAAAKNTPAETKNNAPAIVTDKKNEYVIVCLKHPHGIKFKLGNNRHVTIQGNATHLKDKTTGVLPDGGFGMTTILKEDWEAIKNTYSTMSIFKSGLIFASADTASAQAQAKEHDELKSGFEPVDIKKEKNIGVKDFEK